MISRTMSGGVPRSPTTKELVKNKFPISREFENGAVVPFPADFLDPGPTP